MSQMACGWNKKEREGMLARGFVSVMTVEMSECAVCIALRVLFIPRFVTVGTICESALYAIVCD